MRKAQPGGGCAFLEYTDRYSRKSASAIIKLLPLRYIKYIIYLNIYNSTFDIFYQNFQ